MEDPKLFRKLNAIESKLDAPISSISSLIPQPGVYTHTVTITDSAGDIALGSLQIKGIPAGRTVKHVFIHWLCRQASDTSGAPNSLFEGQDLQVQKNSEGSFYTFFSFAGGEFATPASGASPGDAKKGTYDLAADLALENDDILTFQLTDGVAVGSDLVLDAWEIIVEVTC
jgi:hypothetical protein